MLPRHSPPPQTVHDGLHRWRRDGTLKWPHDALLEHAREKAGRHREPSAAIIDSQTARTTGAGGPGRGFDAGKKTFGRKRHLLWTPRASPCWPTSTLPACMTRPVPGG